MFPPKRIEDYTHNPDDDPICEVCWEKRRFCSCPVEKSIEEKIAEAEGQVRPPFSTRGPSGP